MICVAKHLELSINQQNILTRYDLDDLMQFVYVYIDTSLQYFWVSC